jgi:hypothetical protein
MGNSFDKHLFLQQAIESLETHFLFASFVANAENFCGDRNPFLSGDAAVLYDTLWFELEIINASALSEWEDQGRPSDWTKNWTTTFKADAVELIQKLVALLK